MGQIIGFAIFFKILFFVFLIFLTMLVNRMFSIESIRKEEWIYIGCFALCDILSSTINIYAKQYFLFALLVFVFVGGLVWAYLKDKWSVFSFLSVYSIFLVIASIWGFTFAMESVNIFKVYILSILLSPVSPTSTLNLWTALIIVIIMHIFSLLGMIAWPKIKEKVIK